MEEDRILGILRQSPDRTWTLPELLNRAGFAGKDSKEGKRVLKALVRRGDVERERGRKYRLSRAGKRLEGYLQADHRGVLYLVSDARAGAPVPVHPDDVSRVAAGDRVRAEVVLEGRKSRHYAKILEAAPRTPPRRVGVFRRTGSGGFIELDTPIEQLNPRGRPQKLYDVLIEPEHAHEASDGQLVEIDVQFRWRGGARVPFGRVTEILGNPGERPTELRKLMLENGLTRPFPAEVEAEAQAFGDAPSQADLDGREDLRALPLVTIDGQTAKDFDDAVCAVPAGGDRYRIYVAIADVSHYVRPDAPLDVEAFERGTSTYLTDRAIPMLPEALSNGLCSLKPRVDRLCLVAELLVTGDAQTVDERFYPAVMRSQARLTYEQVAAALEGKTDEVTEALLPHLKLLARLSGNLLRRRLKRGAIDLDLPEAEIVFADDGLPVDAVRRPRNAAHRLIEDLMLAANEAVARFFMSREIPTIYRVHEPPDPTKLANFATVCRNLGLRVRLSDDPRPQEISRLLGELAEHPSGPTLHPLLLRSMSQARYDEDPKGHFGLAAEAYLHFTSPIRRYPDLIVHRLLKAALTDADEQYDPSELQAIAQQSSDRERKAMVAERQSLELDRTFLAQARLGQVFPGRITGVQGFGLFVALNAPFIEGLIPVQTLPDDFYEVDEASIRLTGQRSGRLFSLGDEVEVRIVSAHIGRRQVEFALSDQDDDAEPRSAEVSRARRPPPPRHRQSPRAGSTPLENEDETPRRPFNAKLRLRQLKAAAAQAESPETRRDRPRGRTGPRGRGRKGSTGRRRPR